MLPNNAGGPLEMLSQRWKLILLFSGTLIILVLFYYEISLPPPSSDILIASSSILRISESGVIPHSGSTHRIPKANYTGESEGNPSKATAAAPKKQLVILAWTSFFGDMSHLMPDPKSLKCALVDCRITDDRNSRQTSDAILFHLHDVDVNQLPETKPLGQRWVLVNYESPMNSQLSKVSALGNRLDWLVSYRQDSDFPSPYGKVRRLTNSDPRPAELEEKAFLEKLPVAWMVSNCQSKSGRENVALDIQRHVRLDVYGNCASMFGNPLHKTLKSSDELHGYKYLADRYKFYLAFENSRCTDYITEKAFLPLMAGIVPVVLGGARYNKVLPPMSYIDSASFSSHEALGKYLSQLSSNFTLYRRYLDWREDYVVEHGLLQNTFLCDLCNRLHSKEDNQGKKDIVNMLNDTLNCVI